MCGASYKIVVFVASLISSSFFSLDFLFKGKNPKNVNSLASIPDAISAVINAHAPGIGITSIPSSSAEATTSSPGSDITGVPASLTSAIFFPRF